MDNFSSLTYYNQILSLYVEQCREPPVFTPGVVQWRPSRELKLLWSKKVRTHAHWALIRTRPV